MSKYVTEGQARDMRCCGPDGCGLPSKRTGAWERYCIGSKCMGWRWGGHFCDIERTESSPASYCGLAGQPEE